MKLTILIFASLVTTSAWAVDDMTCLSTGKAAYDQMANSGHIDAAKFIQASGLSKEDVRACLGKANARLASKQIGDLNPNILRRTIAALSAALNGGGSSHAAKASPHRVHSVNTAAASR